MWSVWKTPLRENLLAAKSHRDVPWLGFLTVVFFHLFGCWLGAGGIILFHTVSFLLDNFLITRDNQRQLSNKGHWNPCLRATAHWLCMWESEGAKVCCIFPPKLLRCLYRKGLCVCVSCMLRDQGPSSQSVPENHLRSQRLALGPALRSCGSS